jgi:hypothetical protein
MQFKNLQIFFWNFPLNIFRPELIIWKEKLQIRKESYCNYLGLPSLHLIREISQECLQTQGSPKSKSPTIWMVERVERPECQFCFEKMFCSKHYGDVASTKAGDADIKMGP